MPLPFPLGLNSVGAGSSDAEFFMRDLSRHGRWVAIDGPFNNTDIDPALLDPVTHFPTALPTGATKMRLVVIDGAYIGPMGAYAWSIDSRFTVSAFTSDPAIVFTGGTGGGQVVFGGTPRATGWSLDVSGPFASLSPSERGLKILPLNDPHPERLYSDMVRAALVKTGVTHWRAMEDLRTNSIEVVPYLTDKGAKSGLPSATIEAIVQLCNDLNMGLTMNIHPTAISAYVQRMFTYIAANLTKGLALRCECGNEPWNDAFPISQYLRHQAWIAGYAASGGTRPACVGWTTTGFAPVGGLFGQPFEPGYRVNPDDQSEPPKGRTTQALNAGDYIFGGIYGYGNAVWRVVNNMPSGSVFPPEGNANFVLAATADDTNTGKWRFYADKTLAMYQVAQAAWTAAGHNPALCRPVINMQAGPFLGPEKGVLDANSNALWNSRPSIQLAPYWFTYLGGGPTTGPIPTALDALFVSDKADVESKQHWVRDRRAFIQAAAPAGVTLGNDCVEIYEWFHHNVINAGFNPTGVFKAMRRDGRIGKLLKYGLTLHGRDNPGSLLQIFNLVTGEYDNQTSGWGIFYDATEPQSSTPTNPAGIALAEWSTAALSEVPSADVFYETAPPAGTRTVSAIFGPNISTGFSGVVRATGSRTFDLPFTKAAGSATADMTYTAIAGETLAFTIVPQPGVFTVGSLSGGSLVTPPVDPPPVDPPIDPPAVVIGDQPLAGCIPGSTIVRIISKVLGV